MLWEESRGRCRMHAAAHLSKSPQGPPAVLLLIDHLLHLTAVRDSARQQGRSFCRPIFTFQGATSEGMRCRSSYLLFRKQPTLYACLYTYMHIKTHIYYLAEAEPHNIHQKILYIISGAKWLSFYTHIMFVNMNLVPLHAFKLTVIPITHSLHGVR